MSLSLSSLLNPSPESETRAPPRKNSLPPLQQVQSPVELEKTSSGSAHSNQQFTYPPTADHEAAHALAKLSASPVAPANHWNGHSAPDANQLERQRSWERRSSGYHDPITLPPPVADGSRKTSSPTLEQYQVASRSPEQRRASIAPPQEPHVTLPPLQGFASHASLERQSSKDGPAQAQNLPNGTTHAGNASLQQQPEAPVIARSEASASEHTSAAGTKIQTSTTTQPGDESISSPAPIKQETIPTPQPSSPTDTRRPSDADIHTSKTVASLKSEHSIKTQSPLRESSIPIPSTETAAMEAPAANPKKRPAPSKKKGTASTVKKDKAPPAKKRKVEPKRSATPSSRASKPPTIKGSTKGTPANSSPVPSNRSYSAEPNEEQYDEDEEMDGEISDDNIYCICRKPDNGTFMIGCDGNCDDWFHGKCVGIEERDKNLIDKYICPNCTKNGIGLTTWKRMCRRSECRLPAKIGKTKSGASASKYCSDECGVLYFREMAARTRGREESAKNRSSRRKSSMNGLERPVLEDEVGARGGALSAGEVKALLNASNTAEDFKKLGDGVLSPPATPDGKEQNMNSQFNESEAQTLQRIQTEKEEARRRHAMLKERLQFVTLAKEAATRTATEKELKPKEYCGYDSRLEWTEQRFQAWRNSKAGQQAFELKTLQVEKSSDKDKKLPDDPEDVSICERKKCARHLDWAKLAVDSVRFEMSETADHMRALDRDERELKERAALRAKSGGNFGAEGTVEVHGLGITTEQIATEDKMDIDTKPQEVPSVVETVEKMETS